MNPIAEEIASYLGSAELSDEEFLQHYGVKRRSGRYPWGSGKDPYQHSSDFLARIEALKKKGWKETPENIMEQFNMTSTEYRKEKSLANNLRQIDRIKTAIRLRDKEGLGATEIAKKMGVKNESTVRGWFEQDEKGKIYQATKTADFLREQVNKSRYGMIDVGKNVEYDDTIVKELGNISREKLDTAIRILEKEGYNRYVGRVPQHTNPNQKTTQIVLAKPEVKHKEIFDYDKVDTITNYITKDGGDTFEKKFTYPSSMDSKRLKIRYADEVGPDGFKGVEKDGLVEIRRGCKDLSLNGSRYSQVRILVDGTHYIKGMAVYSDNMPDGIDVVFNTNKGKEKSKMQCLKEIKNDPENPFGSAIKDVELGGQYWYTDKNGKKKLGLINKRADEGDWTEWKDALPSQFLSKQTKEMAKKQLDLAKQSKQAEFDEIKSLTNPTIKKYYLEKFASNCDAAAVELKAASLPGQKYHVIIPNNTLKDNEIYAPGYDSGTKLALIRYPHGGIFEIPVCTVNNKNPLGKKLIGEKSIDAVCINSKVAARLSGADFDGDTVMCIPTDDRKGNVRIQRSNELKDLKGFDNKAEYGTREVIDDKGNKHYINKFGKEINVMKNTNNQMGRISNLITDMTLQGADESKLARAVKHSMVVIDAEKHKLDYKQSEIDNNIQALKDEYQNGGGAFTLISKSKSIEYVPKRQGQARVNIKGKDWYDPKKPEGSLVYITAPDNKLYYPVGTYDKQKHTKTLKTISGKEITYDMNSKKDRDTYEPVMRKDPKTGKVYYTNKQGNIKYETEMRTNNSTKMGEATDARTLVSKRQHPMEIIYADYANSMKAMANQARIEMIKTGRLEYSPSASKIYKKEVSELMADLNEAKKNSIKERTAERLAASKINERKKINPDLKGEDLRKYSQRMLSKYREEVGSIPRRKRNINITDKQWEAIQAGAITENKLKEILSNSDPDRLREKAMPKDKTFLSSAQITRIKSMAASNATIAEIAKKMNVSTSTISNILKGAK